MHLSAMDGHKFVCFDPDVAPKPVPVINKSLLENLFCPDEYRVSNTTSENKYLLKKNSESASAKSNTDSEEFYSCSISTLENGNTCEKDYSFPKLFDEPNQINIKSDRGSYIDLNLLRSKDHQCHTYSFGIGNDTTFDSAMQNFGCKVYSFDMTIVNSTSTSISPNWNFFPVGINSKSLIRTVILLPVRNPIDVTFKTMQDILEIFDQENSVIDILKMDVENSEWEILRQLLRQEDGRKLLSRVKQMHLEIHLEDLLNDSESGRIEAGKYYESVLDGLREIGFVLVHTFINEFSQYYANVRGKLIPIYRESLYVLSP
ncbi:probable methyltransferase-like protein 24 [Hyalella azteca]|uniref:Probable methyltransferase-like protein 24 n=1 Tax=Hyalella azteca TaxID=294128 RepID=A0A8B7NZJ1_HYAAZ|nr:probable methyltransferase-like protein 24 [Hyalella azteca]